MKKYKSILALISAIVGYITILYCVRSITQDGLDADRYRTSGTMNLGDVTGILIGVILVSLSIYIFGQVTKIYITAADKSFELQKQIRTYTLITIVLALVGSLNYLFAATSIILGIISLTMSLRHYNKALPVTLSRKTVAANILAIVASLTSLVSVFSLT